MNRILWLTNLYHLLAGAALLSFAIGCVVALGMIGVLL